MEVLIVDDDTLIHEVLAAVVRRAFPGWNIGFVTDLEAAFARVAHHGEPDLALLDLGLPGQSGLDALRRFRGKFPDLPVVIVSASEEPKAIRAALDAVAAGCARGAGAHDLAVGEGLALLTRTGGDIKLGYSGVGDLARERLGLPADQARRLRRDAERLRSRPLLREAVMKGEVTLRKAEAVLRVAVGGDEAYWVARARTDTVRRLEAAVQGGPEHAEADWHRLRIGLPPEYAHVVEVALDAAGVLLGPTAPLWKRIGVIAMEFLSGHPIDPRESFVPRPAPTPPPGWGPPPPAAGPPDVARDLPRTVAEPADGLRDGAPAASAGEAAGVRAPAHDPYDVLDRLVRLVSGRAGQDELLGRACLLVLRFGSWRFQGFPGFDVWCAEWLGLAQSTVRQRIALERRMQALPELREALRSGRLSYEQARLVARVASRDDVAARIDAAAAKTCIAYRRELDVEAERQMRRAGELRAVVPDEVDELLSDAIRAARAAAKGGLTPGEALVAVALHFVLTWKEAVTRIIRATDEVVLRDAGLCQVPGCSRPADQVHHVIPRSAGGPLEPWNEISLCSPHHLLGAHDGNLEITGTAPDGLRFVLGRREVAAARA